MDNKLVALYTIALISILVLLTTVNTLTLSHRFPVNDNEKSNEEDDGGGGAHGRGSDDPHLSDSVNWEQQELTNLREKILQSLGVTKLPESSTKINITPEEMEAAFQMYYKNIAERERRKRQVRETPMQEQSIVYTYNDQGVNPPSAIAPLAGNQTSTWMYFPISSLANSSSLGSVVTTLRLHRSVSPETPTSPVLHAYRVNARGEAELVSSRQVASLLQDDNGAYLWDVTELASGWMDAPRDNRGMWLSCTHCDKLAHLIELTLTRPQMLVRVHDAARGRAKRAAPGKKTIDDYTPRQGMSNCKSKGEKRCCRKSLTVSMADLGLQDYIQYPKSFNAYYCKGKCPHNYNQASTHANIQSYLSMSKNATRHKKVPKLCCTPSKLGSLIIIIKRNSTEQATSVTWENVIVQECACS